MTLSNSIRALRLSAALGLLFSSGHAMSAGIPTDAKNCSLAQPAEGSGELLTQGIEGRVYPRLTGLPKNYAGCQTTWAEAANQGWQVIAQTYYDKGRPAILETPAAPSYAGMVCHYANGKLVSGPVSECFPYERLRMKSFPQNCAALFKKSGKAPGECVEDGGVERGAGRGGTRLLVNATR